MHCNIRELECARCQRPLYCCVSCHIFSSFDYEFSDYLLHRLQACERFRGPARFVGTVHAHMPRHHDGNLSAERRSGYRSQSADESQRARVVGNADLSDAGERH